MTTRSFASLATLVNPSVPGCSFPLIAKAIHRAAVHTCERSLVWRHTQPAFDLIPGVYQYEYDKPVDTEIVSVLHTAVGDHTMLAPLALDRATEMFPGWVQDSSTPQDILERGGQPRFITHVSPAKYCVLPAPDAEQTYTLRMIYALKPSSHATEMDTATLNLIEEAVVNKALQDLLVLPNTPWSDRELASYHAKQYFARVIELRANANLGQARGMLTARAPRFC